MPCTADREGINRHLDLLDKAIRCTCPDADIRRKDAAIFLSLAVLTDTWKLGIDTRVPLLTGPLTAAVWIGVKAGKAHAQHLMEVQAAKKDAPHRSTCPGCEHPECDAVGEDGT